MRASAAAFEALQAAEPAVVFALYLDLCQQSPARAHVAAHSLSLKARTGAIDRRSVPLLAACLDGAPDEACVLHIARALAVFGRESQLAAATLAGKIRHMTVSHDANYWAFEGSVLSLAFLGGPEASALVDELACEQPPRPLSAESYEGTMPAGRRAKRYAAMLADARYLLGETDPKWNAERIAPVPRRADQPETPRRTATWH